MGAIADASAGLAPVLLVGAPLRRDGRLYNCAVVISRGRDPRRGAEELPAELPRVLREALVRPGRDMAGQEVAIAGRTVPFGPDLLFAADRPARLRRPRRDLRGLLGADPALLRRRAGRRHDPRQPLGLQHHHRQGRRAAHALPVAVGPRGRGLSLLRRRAGREHHRPRLGRAGRRSTSWASCWPRPSGSRRAVALRRRRRHRAHPRRADAHRHLQRLRRGRGAARAAVPPHRLRRTGRASPTSGCARRIRRFPYVPNRPHRLDQDCYEAFNIQVAGPAPPLRSDQRRDTW